MVKCDRTKAQDGPTYIFLYFIAITLSKATEFLLVKKSIYLETYDVVFSRGSQGEENLSDQLEFKDLAF